MASCADSPAPARRARTQDDQLRVALLKAEAARRICGAMCTAEGRAIKRLCQTELRGVGVARKRRLVRVSPGRAAAARPEPQDGAVRATTCLLATAGGFLDRETARAQADALRGCQECGGRQLRGELPVASGNIADVCAAVAPRARAHCVRFGSLAPIGADAAVAAVLREARALHGPRFAALLYHGGARQALVLACDSGWSVCGCSAAGLALAGQDSAAAATDAAAEMLGEFEPAALRVCVLVSGDS